MNFAVILLVTFFAGMGAGLGTVFAGLSAAAGWSVFEIALFNVGVSFGTINWLAVAIFAAVLICTQLKKLKKLHPIVFILAGAVLGIIFQM